MSRAARSLMFFLIYFTYLALVMAPVQRLVIWPLTALWPSRRRAILGVWLRLQAHTVLSVARVLAGVRVVVSGPVIPRTSCVVVMNHQSLLDIPLGVSLIRGPYPLIPTRASYRRGIPGISFLVRLTRFPLVSQGITATRAEFKALLQAAREVSEGSLSLLIYPEGHRSRTGELLPFMGAGLKQVLARTRERPVYAVVADGLWPVRSFSDVALRLAGTLVRATVLGPYSIPGQDSELDDFVERLRHDMIEALDRLRSIDQETSSLARAACATP